MHYYLSSYLLGNQTEYLQAQSLKFKRIAYIQNAMDIVGIDQDRLKKSTLEIVNSLTNLGFKVDELDLKDYFVQG